MSPHSFYSIIGYSLIGSLITTFTFAASASGKLQLSTLTLPMVAETALIVGAICGILLSPLMYWSLKDKNLLTILPIIYTLAFISTALLCSFEGRTPIYGAFIYWVLILIAIKIFGPVAVK